MIRWMCGVNVTDIFMCNEMTDRLETDDINTALQNRACLDHLTK